jgi:fibro-slime domain-containing protein
MFIFKEKMFFNYSKRIKAIALFTVAFLTIIFTGIISTEKAYTTNAPTSVYLSGVLRDFSDTHPDFERTNGVDGFAYGLDPDITLDTLDSNKKPQYKSGSYSTTTKYNFDQWYRNVSGINKSVNYGITLTDSDGDGSYTYYNSNFFPLDGMNGFDNQGRNHNYHFTYELHGVFGYKGGEVFEFKGDDDVWVYINGQKIIDLGGVHGEETKLVNLDDVASSIGIIPGRNYNFDFFFAERHTTQSNFKIETTLNFIRYAD